MSIKAEASQSFLIFIIYRRAESPEACEKTDCTLCGGKSAEISGFCNI